MEHLPYTPKLAPRNFLQFFGHNKLLSAKQFASCHLLAKDTWHRFPLCWDTNNWCLSGTNAYMSMVIMCRPDVYHLLPMCHVHIKIRKQFPARHCLLPYFMKYPCTNCVQFKFTVHSCYHHVIVDLIMLNQNIKPDNHHFSNTDTFRIPAVWNVITVLSLTHYSIWHLVRTQVHDSAYYMLEVAAVWTLCSEKLTNGSQVRVNYR